MLVGCIPVAFVLTILLFPPWGWVERRWGIESVGHSGPANWCFWLVYGACVAAAGGLELAGRRAMLPND